METINLKNYQIESFIKVLSYPMPFSKGRIKNRFMSILMEKAHLIEKNRLEIINELVEKDKENQAIIENGSFKMGQNATKFQEEYEKLMKEDCIIDITPSLKVDLGPIKDMINKSDIILDNQQTAIVEEVMTELENIKPKAEKKTTKK